MESLLQTNQEAVNALESRTLQLSLNPEAPPPIFSVPTPLAHALMLQPSKYYTIGNVMTAFHTYILNHSLCQGGGLLTLDEPLTRGLAPASCASHIPYSAPRGLAPASCASHIPYSAALVHLCRQLQPK